jgi:oxidase EvaA
LSVQAIQSQLKYRLGLTDVETEFLVSAFVVGRARHSLVEFEAWFAERRRRQYQVDPIPLEKIEGWRFEESTGNLVHSSGRFFRIQGIRVQTNKGPVKEWDQPIIFQPEIGVLGIVTAKFDGVLHFLMH